MDIKSRAQQCFDLTGLLEAEVLVYLMLNYWGHPYANDKEFANGLLEDAAQLLQMVISGEEELPGVTPESLSLIAAIWLVERQQLASDDPQLAERAAWRSKVREVLPSCFCEPDELGP